MGMKVLCSIAWEPRLGVAGPLSLQELAGSRQLQSCPLQHRISSGSSLRLQYELARARLTLLEYPETEEEGLTQNRAHRHGEREADSGEFLLACACLVVVGEMKRDPPGFEVGWVDGWRAVGAQEEAEEHGDKHILGQVGFEGLDVLQVQFRGDSRAAGTAPCPEARRCRGKRSLCSLMVHSFSFFLS